MLYKHTLNVQAAFITSYSLQTSSRSQWVSETLPAAILLLSEVPFLVAGLPLLSGQLHDLSELASLEIGTLYYQHTSIGICGYKQVYSWQQGGGGGGGGQAMYCRSSPHAVTIKKKTPNRHNFPLKPLEHHPPVHVSGPALIGLVKRFMVTDNWATHPVH